MGSKRPTSAVLALLGASLVAARSDAAPRPPEPPATRGTPLLDATFGVAGAVRSADNGTVRLARFDGLAVDPSGRIVVTGPVLIGDDPLNDSIAYDAPGVARFSANGTLDPTFGDAGIAVLPTAGTGGAPTFDGAGRILVGGSYDWHAREVETMPAKVHVGAVRLTADGALDTTFGDGGRLLVSDLLTLGSARLGSADGSMLFGFHSSNLAPSSDSSGVVRVTADGVVDPTYGIDGFAAGGGPTALAVDAQGRAVVWSGLVFRLDAHGSFDPTFGNGGYLSDPDGTTLVTPAAAVDAQGRIYVDGPSGFGARRLRYSADGVLDASFVPARKPAALGLPGDAELTRSVETSDPADPERRAIAGGFGRTSSNGLFVSYFDPARPSHVSVWTWTGPKAANSSTPAPNVDLTAVVLSPDGAALWAAGYDDDGTGPRPLLIKLDLAQETPVALPNLRVRWVRARAVDGWKPGIFRVRGRLRVTNVGEGASDDAEVYAYLTRDGRVSEDRGPFRVLRTGRLEPGQSVALDVNDSNADKDFFDRGRRLLARVNPRLWTSETRLSDDSAVSASIR